MRFTDSKSMIINLTATIHIANNVSEINAIRKRHACKIIFTCPSVFHCCFLDNPGHGTS